MHLKAKVSLLCIVGLLVIGTVTQAEDLQVRFLDGNGEVITGRDVGVLDQFADVVLQKIAGQPNGVYVITDPSPGKLQFVLSDPVTGNVSKASGMVPADFAAGTLIDITTTAPVSPLQAPANDDCANAIGPLAIGSNTAGSTVGATPAGFPTVDCGTAILSGAPGVWYTVLGTGNTITASTCLNLGNPAGGADYDDSIGVYCFDCDNPTCVAGLDDGFGCPSFHSEVSWTSQAGALYTILVHGFSTSSGNFNMVLTDDGIATSADVNCTPAGACCNCLPSPFNCTVETEAGCADLQGDYVGDFTLCVDPVGMPTAHAGGNGEAIDSGLPDATSTITIGAADDCIVADVDVAMNVTHTFMGDLIIAISHGPSLLLLDSQCGGTNNVHSTADDEGTLLSCLAIANGPTADVHWPPSVGGMGDDVLSIFDGGSSGGDWTLTVSDNFGGDTGTLDSWSIIFDCGTVVCDATTTTTGGAKGDDSSSASSDDQFDGRPFGTVAPNSSGSSSDWTATGTEAGAGGDTPDTDRTRGARKLRGRGE